MVKRVGYSSYTHISNLSELLVTLNEEQRLLIRSAIDKYSEITRESYEVIKFNKKTQGVSLIESPDWNKAHEPTVGTSYCINKNGTIRKTSGGNKVYHNKWQFVSEDYKGFNIEKSKERTRLWNSIPDIKEHKTRIGNKDYWYELLEKNKIEI